MILEILISTMNRSDLSFLNDLFGNNYSHLQLLIINQTRPDTILESNNEHVRVINSFEYGLSKSRNLAIKNAIGDICLIADDDVQYITGFDTIIKETFLRATTASLIQFKIDTFCGRDYKEYSENSKRLSTKKDIFSVSSIEIAFRRRDVLENQVLFNTLFGLGSCFPSGEEYLFMKKALNLGLIIQFENVSIVKHAFERTANDMASDNFIKSQAAIYFCDYKTFSYLFLLKYIFFLLSRGAIGVKDLKNKYLKGFNAIKEYKRLSP